MTFDLLRFVVEMPPTDALAPLIDTTVPVVRVLGAAAASVTVTVVLLLVVVSPLLATDSVVGVAVVALRSVVELVVPLRAGSP